VLDDPQREVGLDGGHVAPDARDCRTPPA
jgi:hypothetical protein